MDGYKCGFVFGFVILVGFLFACFGFKAGYYKGQSGDPERHNVLQNILRMLFYPCYL